ncbi:MAG: TrkA family potassium uptake protein [Methanobacteriaceae archaeon]|nr:TrkA family potassium uptake protein [Methanobacteriaceae archaeon]
MYVIIVGAGRVGLNLALSLSSSNIDVTLIEIDEKTSTEVAEETNLLVINGNGTDTKILQDANISEADVFVAATGDDQPNFLASALAKEYTNLKKIISRVNDQSHEETFKELGIDSTVSPELTAAGYLEKIITRPKIADLIVLGKGSTEILDLKVENKKIVGKQVSEISPTDNFIICAVYDFNTSELSIPQRDTVLEYGQKISVLVKADHVSEVTKLFV